MPARTLPNLGLEGFFDLGEDGWKDEMDLNLLKLSVLVQGQVDSIEAALPGGPSNGDIVILDEAHGTNPNEIAIRDDGAWVYVTPNEGWTMYNLDDSSLYRFNGTLWAVVAGGENKVVTLLVNDPDGDDLATGDGQMHYRVPSILNGKNLVAVAAAAFVGSSSGAVTAQIHNVTGAADMLSTPLTIDESETDSSTAATPAAIDGAQDDVATGDMLRIDVDGAGTGVKGLLIEMQFA